MIIFITRLLLKHGLFRTRHLFKTKQVNDIASCLTTLLQHANTIIRLRIELHCVILSLKLHSAYNEVIIHKKEQLSIMSMKSMQISDVFLPRGSPSDGSTRYLLTTYSDTGLALNP